MKLELMNNTRWNRLKAIRSFQLLADSGEPCTEFIPRDSDERDKLYYEYSLEGITLPRYSTFSRKHLRKRDMKVLTSDWTIKFRYKKEEYAMLLKKGFCFDGASVPLVFRMGNVTAHNSYVSKAAPVHDALFALKLMTYEDANNVFSGLLRDKGLNKFALVRYMLGVRSPIGRRLYRKSDPRKSWLKGFVEFIHLL